MIPALRAEFFILRAQLRPTPVFPLIQLELLTFTSDANMMCGLT